MADERITLSADFSGVSREAKEAGQSLDEMASKGDKAAKSTANLGQTALQGGRFLQDFAQGGIGGVLNNIEGLATALGGGPGLAGVMTAVGLAAYFAVPRLKAWWAAIFDGANEVPKATDKLDQLKEALAANGKELEALKDKHILTNKELVRFNELTAEQTRLQTEQAAALKKKKEADQVAAMKPHGEAEAAKERQSAMEAMFGGNEAAQKALADAMKQRMEKELEVAWKNMMKPLPAVGTPGREAAAKARKAESDRFEKIRQALEKGPQEAINRAIATGDEAAMRDIVRFLPGEDMGPGGQFRGDIESMLPEQMKAQDAEIEAMEEEGRRAIEAGRARRKLMASRARQKAQAQAQIKRQIAADTKRKNDEAAEQSAQWAARQKAGRQKKERDFGHQVKAASEQYDQARRAAFGSDIDERATIEAAQMHAAGGFMDQHGRFHPADREQQSLQLQRLIQRELARRFPQMAPMHRGGIAAELAIGAHRQIDQTTAAAAAQAMASGTNATIAQVQALQGMVSNLNAAVRQIQMRNRLMARDVRDTVQRGQSLLTNGLP